MKPALLAAALKKTFMSISANMLVYNQHLTERVSDLIPVAHSKLTSTGQIRWLAACKHLLHSPTWSCHGLEQKT